ncbi:Cse1-domain-containing protein [Amylostereum chailletii]|nr:Cse1-domain-containing protein [Amylostereum chailletii]
MSDIPTLLLASLNPQTRKQAEQSLQTFSRQPTFLVNLLQLVLNPAQDRAVRLAGSVYLKNVVKLGWMEDDEFPVPAADKDALRPQLVPAMIALSSPNDKAIRAQIAESVSLIAELDFPHAWPDLIDQLVSSLNPEDFNINVGVLETAHSIFRPWRSQSRSNELFTTINLVIEKFLAPFHQLFQFTIRRLFTTPPPPQPTFTYVAHTMSLLVEIFFDLTCQDLPPSLEDGHQEFFDSTNGYFMRLMAWDPDELKTDPDESTPSFPSKIRTNILEIAEMYVKLYPEVLQRSQSVEAFVRAVWELVGGGKQLGIAYDQLVSQALRFISTAIRAGPYKDLFSSRDTISGLIQGVVVPNVGVREQDLEAFEDSPLEFVRGDMLVTEISTPRQAAGDVIKALVSSGFEQDTTDILNEWILRGLETYAKHKTSDEGWKSKDTAIYLFESLATRGGTTSHGVTSTNPLVNVVQWFGDNIFQDLQSVTVHAVLQVDAIRYLYTFRNQLTKEQLLSVLPLLTRHLASTNVVVYTYAAVAIDRILAIRLPNNSFMFNSADIQDVAPQLLDVLLSKIESSGTPEKVAENDFLMRCVARIIITARQTLASGFERLLQRLVTILGVISKNPSNPNFDQYIFESISALIRFIGPTNPAAIGVIEPALFGPFTVILQQDIDQYIPYVFQILAQMLALHAGVPTDYRSLLPFLLTPAIWQQKGSIPGLVKLLQAFLTRDSAQMVATGQFTSVLGIVQQRLIPSKINDAWGFELLKAVVQHVSPADLQQYFHSIMITLLTRMQNNKTDNYVYHFVYFLCYTMAINVEGISPDYVIAAVEQKVQPGLWSSICTNFIIPQAPKLAAKDRKVAVVGLTRMLTGSTLMLQEPSVKAWPGVFSALVQLFREPQALKKSGTEDTGAGVTDIDLEEQSAGYQAAYSRLATADAAPVDPVAHVGDVQAFVGQEMVKVTRARAEVKSLIAEGDKAAGGIFVKSLAGAGYVL